MAKRLTLPQLKKYDITQKVIEALADAESRAILFSIIKTGKTATQDTRRNGRSGAQEQQRSRRASHRLPGGNPVPPARTSSRPAGRIRRGAGNPQQKQNLQSTDAVY